MSRSLSISNFDNIKDYSGSLTTKDELSKLSRVSKSKKNTSPKTEDE